MGEINAHLGQFDGKEVTLTGYLLLGPEGHHQSVFESRAWWKKWESFFRPGGNDIDQSVSTLHCLTIENGGFAERHMRALNHRVVTLHGRIDAQFFGPNDLNLWNCGNPGLLVDERSIKALPRTRDTP